MTLSCLCILHVSRELHGNSISQIPKHVFENLTELLHL